ncbi:MAG: ABC transporter permease subunit [Actinomycetota bacterium]|nr:MAG: ABC transporter permease subunit [Actinomycetota bacterium]
MADKVAQATRGEDVLEETVDQPSTVTREMENITGGRSREIRLARGPIIACQLAILIAFLLAWQYLPQIPALSSRFKFMDPFFISSPTQVAQKVVDLATGRNESILIWPYLWNTLQAALVGLVIGICLGALVGLLLSGSQFAARVMRPFIDALNATPRVAFIPIIVIIFGPTQLSSIVVSLLVVFFVSFFNAYEGGVTVAPQLVQNASILGASRAAVMRRVRLPFVLAWTMAAIPVALAFSLLSVVTAEILTGAPGIGRLITQATSTVDATLTFAIVIYLAVMGASLVAIADAIKRRAMHWWVAGG